MFPLQLAPMVRPACTRNVRAHESATHASTHPHIYFIGVCRTSGCTWYKTRISIQSGVGGGWFGTSWFSVGLSWNMLLGYWVSVIQI